MLKDVDIRLSAEKRRIWIGEEFAPNAVKVRQVTLIGHQTTAIHLCAWRVRFIL